MSTTTLIVIWIACGFCGAAAAAAKRATVGGLVLGLLFGPIGVIAALGLDWRPHCLNCGQRLDHEKTCCPFCSIEFEAPKHG